MAYNPNPADPMQPTEDKFVESAAKEFRELKEYIQELVAEVAANEGSVAALESRALRVLPPETVAGLAIAPSRANKLLGFDSFGQPAYYSLDSSPAIPSASTNWLYVNEYGTHWDGVTDNTADIRLAHNTANASGRPVSYAGILSVVIQADAQIKVNTSVDFAGCEIKPINGIAPQTDPSKLVYVLEDPDCPVVTVTGPVAAADLIKGSLHPTRGLFEGSGAAHITCGKQIPNRDLTGTVDYEQSFNVVRNSEVTQPLSTDLTAFAAAITVRYRKTSLRPIKIQNVCLREDRLNWNRIVLIHISRCNVVLDGVTILPAVDQTPYNNYTSLIATLRVSDVSIKNVIATARPLNTPSAGTYVLQLSTSADIYIDRVRAIFGWGMVGSNNTNGVYYSNCVLNRVDGHEGLHNVFVDNCVFHEKGIIYGWGGGIAKISNSILYDGTSLISCRTDYSCQHFGTLIAEDCSMYSSVGLDDAIVDLGSFQVGAPGLVPIELPNIFINNIRRLGKAPTPDFHVTGVNIRVVPGAVVYAPQIISINNVRGDGLWRFRGFVDWHNLEANPITTITQIFLDDIKATAGATNVLGLAGYAPVNVVTTPMQIDINATGCQNLLVRCLITVRLAIRLYDSSVAGVEVDPATTSARVELHSCRLNSGATGYAKAPLGGLASGGGPVTGGFTSLRDCTISADEYDFSKVAAFMGNLCRVAVSTLPAGVTTTLAFTGYRAPGIFL